MIYPTLEGGGGLREMPVVSIPIFVKKTYRIEEGEFIVSGMENTCISIQHQKWNERKTIKTSWR